MKQFSDQVNNIAQQRIQQVLDQGGQKIKKIPPKIIRGAIEGVYQAPFRLLGKFGKKKFTQLKSKVNNAIKQFS